MKSKPNIDDLKREYMKNYMRNRRKTRRQKMIDLLGGECIRCGSKNNLEFDHIDPKIKEFDIAYAKDFPEEKLVSEVKKCQLMCRDCHLKKTRDNWEFSVLPPVSHGKIWMYKSKKCRCDDCKKAMSDYLKNLKERKLKLADMFEEILKKYS